jgi:hypothetical protein
MVLTDNGVFGGHGLFVGRCGRAIVESWKPHNRRGWSCLDRRSFKSSVEEWLMKMWIAKPVFTFDALGRSRSTGPGTNDVRQASVSGVRVTKSGGQLHELTTTI